MGQIDRLPWMTSLADPVLNLSMILDRKPWGKKNRSPIRFYFSNFYPRKYIINIHMDMSTPCKACAVNKFSDQLRLRTRSFAQQFPEAGCTSDSATDQREGRLVIWTILKSDNQSIRNILSSQLIAIPYYMSINPPSYPLDISYMRH